jgi:hypothetical protein
MHKAWIWDCTPIAGDKEAIIREYNTNIDYGFEAVSKPDSKKMKGFAEWNNESYDIGQDYAQHTMKMTPGQDGYDPKHKGDNYKPSKSGSGKPVTTRPETTDISKKDIKEWSSSKSTIDKYRERYKEHWKAKLNEVVQKILEKL